MTRDILLFFCFLALVSCRASLLYAEENQAPSVDYPVRLWIDLRELPAQPIGFSGTQWMLTGGVMAATWFALAHDGEFQTDVQGHRTDFYHSLSNLSTSFGDYHYQVPLEAYLWSLGTVSNFGPVKRAAADGMEASFLAAGLVTPLITKVSGRALPLYHDRALAFHPFIFKKGHESFPSDHTTEAFTMASVLDADFRSTLGYWQTPFLFAMAAGTGFSRIYDDKHYLSDVILGAGIGSSIGYWVADKKWTPPVSIHIWPLPRGLILVWEF